MDNLTRNPPTLETAALMLEFEEMSYRSPADTMLSSPMPENALKNVRSTTAAKPSKGISRFNWDLRYDSPYPVKGSGRFNPLSESGGGMLAMPGTYTIKAELISRDGTKLLTEAKEFQTKILNNNTLPRKDLATTLEFNTKMSELTRVMRGANQFVEESVDKIVRIQNTILQSSAGTKEMLDKARNIELELRDILFEFEGPQPKASWEELDEIDMPLNRRLSSVIYSTWRSTQGVTSTMEDSYDIISEEFPPLLERIRKVNKAISELENMMENAKLQWTPGRIPEL